MPASKYKVKLGKTTSTAILHTRLFTQGSPKKNRNNHPIPVGERGKRLVGVHNGVIWNDDEVFKKHVTVPRKAEVDSEAVFAYLYEHGPRPKDLTDIGGSYALGYLKEDEPNQLYLCRGCDSPLVVARSKHGWVFASTREALDLVAPLLDGWVKDGEPAHYGEGKYGVYFEGNELEYADFEYDIFGGYSRYSSRTWVRDPITGNLTQYPNDRMSPATRQWWELENGVYCDWEYGTPGLYSSEYDKGQACSTKTKPEVLSPEDMEEILDLYDGSEGGNSEFAIPDVGHDARVRAGSQWTGSYLDPEDERFYYHCYDDGSYIRNQSIVPPFRWCSMLSTTHSPLLSSDEREARLKAASVVEMFKRGRSRGVRK